MLWSYISSGADRRKDCIQSASPLSCFLLLRLVRSAISKVPVPHGWHAHLCSSFGPSPVLEGERRGRRGGGGCGGVGASVGARDCHLQTQAPPMWLAENSGEERTYFQLQRMGGLCPSCAPSRQHPTPSVVPSHTGSTPAGPHLHQRCNGLLIRPRGTVALLQALADLAASGSGV